MKRKNFNLAIIMMVVAAFISVAVVSCKKEDNSSLAGQVTSKPAFTPPQVDDMDAHLKGFKEKMKSSTRGDDERLSLEEAAWYLSGVANYDFSKANVEFTDLRYDTLTYQINVCNGQVLLSDLNTVYSSMTNDIDAFYQNLDLQDKHFRFIGTSISENGTVSVQMVTSFRHFDHTWYFPLNYFTDTLCDYYFSDDSVYVWDGLAIYELERLIHLLEGREFAETAGDITDRVYFLCMGIIDFDFRSCIDPYGSPFNLNSRLFARYGDAYATTPLNKFEMCYCLDSYIALPFEYIDDHPNLSCMCPLQWNIEGETYLFYGNKWHTHCHKLSVKIGLPVTSNYEPINY